jgi:hypothetical protein
METERRTQAPTRSYLLGDWLDFWVSYITKVCAGKGSRTPAAGGQTMNQYIITEEELDEWEAGGMCWSEEQDMQRGIRSHPYQSERDASLISFDAIMGIHHELTNINNIASHIGDLLTPLNQCLDAHNQRIQKCEREKVLGELTDGLQEFPFSQNQKIHDLTRCVLCGKHFKSSELGLRVAAGWIHNNPDKCKQETREELRQQAGYCYRTQKKGI